MSESSVRTAEGNCLTPWPCLALASSTAKPLPRKYAAHALVAAGSARSTRLRTISLGLPLVSSSTSGFRLERGTRASRISHTASICFSWSEIIRRVLVMWPGYHWMFMALSSILPPVLSEGGRCGPSPASPCPAWRRGSAAAGPCPGDSPSSPGPDGRPGCRSCGCGCRP